MVYVFLAQGFETVEALMPVDILRRAEIEVKTVGIGSKYIVSSHGIRVEADIEEKDTSTRELEAVVIPGGLPGTINLSESKTVRDFIMYCFEKKLLIASICAAPSILGEMGILQNKEAVAFPDFTDKLIGARISEKYVVQDGNIITARGMGVSTEFSLAIVEYLVSKEKSKEIKRVIQCKK